MEKHQKENIDFTFCITLATILLTAKVRISLLAIPLERDEGGFAYIGRHLFSERLYTDLHDNKLPGLYGLYALFIRSFGYTPEGIHTGLLLCNTVAIWLIFRLFSNIFNKWTGTVSAIIFALTSLSVNVNGFAAHANQLLMPFALGGLVVLHKGLLNNRLFYFGLAGLLLGLAFTIKQQAVLYGVFSGVWILWTRIQMRADVKQITRDIIVFSMGAILPFATICAYFLLVDRLDDFWLCTVELPAQLGNAPNLGDRFNLFRFYFSKVTRCLEPVWIVAAAGWIVLPFMAFCREARAFGILFPVFCAASVLIGVAYYPHYFVLCLPAVSLLVGVMTDAMRRSIAGIRGNICTTAILFLLVSFPVINNKWYYYKPDFHKIHLDSYGANRFMEMQEIGKELKQQTLWGERIGILGSEPEILVVAEREAASRHLFLYNLFSQGPKSALLQQQYLNDLKTSRPNYLVRVLAEDSWGSNYQETSFFKEVLAYVEANYTLYKQYEGIMPEEKPILIYKKRE